VTSTSAAIATTTAQAASTLTSTSAAAATTAAHAASQQHKQQASSNMSAHRQKTPISSFNRADYVLCISGDNNVVDCTFQTRKRCKMDDIFALVIFSLPFLIYLLGKYTFSTNKILILRSHST
jgi:hypothetical protein